MFGQCDVQYGNATFRGIEFDILPVTNTIGRQIVTTKFPFTERHHNEDLGSTPERFTVSGVFTGEDARDKLTVAKRLWVVEGDGVFFEPTENRSHDVTLLSVTFDYDHRKLNTIPFTLELVSKGDQAYPTISTNFFGQADAVVDQYTTDVRNYYIEQTAALGDFASVSSGFDASVLFVFDAIRQHVTDGFSQIATQTRALQASGDAGQTVDDVTEVFETAVETSNAPLAFYEQASELVIAGNEVESFQGQMFALVALGYYFETLDDRVDFIGLQRFRERAVFLKNQADDAQISGSIDSLILEAGALAGRNSLKFYEGTPHALVASYRLFGNVSRAYDILESSYGVSGANLSPLRYSND